MKFAITFSFSFQIDLLHLYIVKIRAMHNRLKQFLTMENLSPARFAEELGIQRSGISHLLSGRNKPSFEFLQKMMSAYPDLNAEWLILGKGRPFKSDRPLPEIDSKAPVFTEPDDSSTLPDDDLFSDYQEFDTEIPQEQLAENRVNETPPARTPSKNGKFIERILVLYSDGTFEEK